MRFGAARHPLNPPASHPPNSRSNRPTPARESPGSATMVVVVGGGGGCGGWWWWWWCDGGGGCNCRIMRIFAVPTLPLRSPGPRTLSATRRSAAGVCRSRQRMRFGERDSSSWLRSGCTQPAPKSLVLHHTQVGIGGPWEHPRDRQGRRVRRLGTGCHVVRRVLRSPGARWGFVL